VEKCQKEEDAGHLPAPGNFLEFTRAIKVIKKLRRITSKDDSS
jgi:hypothetical protein